MSERTVLYRQLSGRSSKKIGLLFATLAGFLTIPARAADLTYFLGYGLTYTTNIDRVTERPQAVPPVVERDEYVHSLIAGFTYVDATPTLNLRFVTNVEYLNYANSTSDNQARPTLDAFALWAISPQRFTWTLEDNVRQVSANPTQPNTPSNTVTANLLNTGPDFYLRFGPVNTLQLGARAGNVYIENSDADNVRSLGYVRWLNQISPQTTWSLNYEALAVDYKNEVPNNNFARQDYFVRVLSKPTRSTFDLSLGGSKIRQDRANDVDGSLARLSWTREINTESALGTVAEASYGDTGTDLSATANVANTPVSGPGVSTSQNLVTQGIFYAKRGTIFYRQLGSHLSIETRVFINNLEFETVSLDDRKDSGGAGALTYKFTGATSAGIFGDRRNTHYLNVVREYTDTNYGLRYSYLITRTLSTTLELARSERDSTDPTLNYVDKRVLFTLLYKSGLPVRR